MKINHPQLFESVMKNYGIEQLNLLRRDVLQQLNYQNHLIVELEKNTSLNSSVFSSVPPTATLLITTHELHFRKFFSGLFSEFIEMIDSRISFILVSS